MTTRTEDYVYVIVQRVIEGRVVRYIERMASRNFTDYRLDALFLDSFLSYDGISMDNSSVELSTSSGWTESDEITVTADVSKFESGDVGNGVTVWIPGGAVIRITIANFDSATVVRGNPSMIFDPADSGATEIPALLRDTPSVNWSRAVDVVAGVDHLEGLDVSILANGVVLSGTVSGGEVALDGLYDVVHVGLPITADVESLDLDDPQANIRDKKKNLRSVSLLVDRSRSTVKAGPDSSNLTTFVPEGGIQLATDIFTPGAGKVRNEIIEVGIPSRWNKPGRVFIRHEQPLPLAILAIMPDGAIGG
jgi:hypothetical protein